MFPLSKLLYKYATEAHPNFQDVTSPIATKLSDTSGFLLTCLFWMRLGFNEVSMTLNAGLPFYVYPFLIVVYCCCNQKPNTEQSQHQSYFCLVQDHGVTMVSLLYRRPPLAMFSHILGCMLLQFSSSLNVSRGQSQPKVRVDENGIRKPAIL